MQLKQDFILRGGKYKIEKVLGQGGFGITYLAEQSVTITGDIGTIQTKIKVTIKEFFIKDLCNRDSDTQHVSVPLVGSQELAERFRQKFVKEARSIARLDHNNIIKVLDVFEENGTAYYVMEYIEGGSLGEHVARCGTLTESEALHYIYQIADALRYIHEKRMNHLDVKPSNILIKEGAISVLIDFGLAKQYDQGGNETSSTPVGVSKGYAPIEQYKSGSVSSFSPSTDIYSLGATLYKLVMGTTPPEAYEVFDGGLPKLPESLSPGVRRAITSAMQPSRNARPQSIEEFLAILAPEEMTECVSEAISEVEDEETQITTPINEQPSQPKPISRAQEPTPAEPKGRSKPRKSRGWLVAAVLGGVVVAVAAILLFSPAGTVKDKTPFTNDHYQALSSPSVLVISDGHTAIADNAFLYCRALLSVTIPHSVSSIGNCAFSSCYGLSKIVIPNSVISIGDEAFSHCENLDSIALPSSINSIGVGAFFYCRGMRSITIPESVTTIGDFAFSYCDGLTEIAIPDSVTSIGEEVFSHCGKLIIWISEKSPIYTQLKQEYGAMVKARV